MISGKKKCRGAQTCGLFKLERETRWSKTSASLGDGRFLDLSGFQTLGTNPHATHCSVDDGSDTLQVRIPTSLGQIVSMRDVVAKSGSLSTNLTNLRHMASKKSLERAIKALSPGPCQHQEPRVSRSGVSLLILPYSSVLPGSWIARSPVRPGWPCHSSCSHQDVLRH